MKTSDQEVMGVRVIMLKPKLLPIMITNLKEGLSL